MFSSAFSKILGKSFEGRREEAKEFDDGLMYDFNMNYCRPDKINPFSSAQYHDEENAFIHELSVSSSGKFYGLNKIKDLMPLKDFMTLPAVVVEELIDGILKGEEIRFELEKQATPPEGDKKLTDANKKLLEEARKAGLI